MSENLVREIMQAEQASSQTYTEAQSEADKIIAEAEKEAISIHEDSLAKAKKQAQEILDRGKKTAEEARSGILDSVQQEISALETEVDANVDAATAYVVRQILGQ
jgi:ATP synthase H subunit